MDAVADHGVITGDTISNKIVDLGRLLKLEEPHRPKTSSSSSNATAWTSSRSPGTSCSEATQGPVGRRQEMTGRVSGRRSACRFRPDGTNPLGQARQTHAAHPRPVPVVIFGVTGDLSRKKLMPAITTWRPAAAVVRTGRTPPAGTGPTGLRADRPRRGQDHAAPRSAREVWDRLAGKSALPVQGTFDDSVSFAKLAETLRRNLDVERGNWRQPRLLPVHPAERLPVVTEQLKNRAGRPQRRPVEPGGIELSGHDPQSAIEPTGWSKRLL